MSATDAMPATLASADKTQAGDRIGPNAILQVFAVLEECVGTDRRDTIARQAGLSHHLIKAPGIMVVESEVVQLHQAVRHALSTAQANDVLREAGTRTALYILDHRIPKAAQRLLKILPVRIASRALLHAIAKHAWTFTGSGTFRFDGAYPATIELIDCPACSQVYAPNEECVYYRATMEGLFRKLVHRNAQLVERLTPDSDGRVRHFRLDWHT